MRALSRANLGVTWVTVQSLLSRILDKSDRVSVDSRSRRKRVGSTGGLIEHYELELAGGGDARCRGCELGRHLVAAQARRNPVYASKRLEPPPTRHYDPPPADSGSDPFAWRGDRRDPGSTGSIAAQRPAPKNAAADDSDWVEEPGPRPSIDWSSARHKVN